MSKAYDRVEWDFLEEVMRTMGFPRRWRMLIMKCVRSVTYSVMINGQQCGYIKPSRGIRQGDPLSPYLFLLCAEGLSGLLNKAKEEKMIKGVSAARNGPQVTHLFFVDDSLLFCQAKRAECLEILRILQLYERSSGQKVNMEKVRDFFQLKYIRGG